MCPAATVVKNDLFCNSSGEGHTQFVHEIGARIMMSVFLGQELSDTHRHSARDNAHLVNRVSARKFPSDESMSCLMIRRYPRFRIAYGFFSYRSHNVLGLFKVVHIYFLFVLSRGA